MKKKLKIHYSSLFAILFIIVSIYLIHSILLFDRIETFIRYMIVCIIGFIDLFILWKLFFGKKKKKKRYIYSAILIIFTILFGYIGFNLNEIYSFIANFNKKVIISTSLVALSENKNTNLSKLKDAKIGVSIEGNTIELSKDILDKYKLEDNNQIISFDSYTEAINALYNKEVDLIFLPTNYVDVFGTREGYEDIGDKISIVDTTEKETTKEEVKLSGSSKDVSEPFTILLIGIDSTINGLQNADSFNGDSLIVVTFNPSTMSATMLSIPRDSYVPITCMNNIDNKITHSAASGTKCVINTIQNFLDIKIDYFMKINFTGVVDLVNAVGGVDIDVPYSFCEQNSQRKLGSSTVYVKQGFQTLDGEQALAFARNRKNNADFCAKEWTLGTRNDFVRSEHQQIVIQAILNKMKAFSSIDDLKKILSVISKNIDTNMSESTIFSFYNVAKDVLISSSSDSVISIEKLYLDGTGQMIYDERSRLVLWDYVLNQKSLAAVKKAMKDNLNGSEKQLIKTFSYTIGENYEQAVIGKGYSGTERYKLLANLVGENLTDVQAWANSNGLTLKIEYVKASGKADGIVVSQEYPESKRIDLIPNKTMKIEVVKNDTTPTPSSKVDCMINSSESACKLPNFVGKSKSNVTSWANSISNTIDVKFETEESDEQVGLILKQSVEAGTNVKEILEKKITIVITTAKAKENNNNNNNNNNNDNSSDNQSSDPKPNENTNNNENNNDNQGGDSTTNPDDNKDNQENGNE